MKKNIRMMKRIVYITLPTFCLFMSVGCTQVENEEQAVGRPHEGELFVTAQLYDETWTTRSAESGEAAIPSDTIFIDEDIYVTAQTEPYRKNRPLTDTTGTQQSPTTRGTLVSRASDIAQFKLLFFDSSSSNFDATTTLTNEFTAKYSSGAYSLTPTMIWASGTPSIYSFMAYTPIEGTSGITRESDNRTLAYKVPATIAEQPDLCIAIPNLNQQNTEGSDNNQQNFVFHHALTAIGIAFKGYDVRITQATISKVKNQGKVSLQPVNTDSTTTIAWSDVSGDESYDLGITQDWGMHQWNSTWTNVTASDSYLMMPPQTFTDETAQLTITYEGRNNQKGGTIKVPLSQFGEWKAGHKIMYNIRLKTKPGITTSNLDINSFIAGYTTTSPLSMSLAADDELTFTWTADWLRICRDPRTGSTTNGYASGWKTGVGGPWNNIYFFSSTNNPSAIANRTATVTVTGKKSGTSTFTVTQSRVWEPKLPSTISTGWTPGNVDLLALTNPPSTLKNSISVKSSSITGSDQFGISPTSWGYSISGKTLHVHYNRYNETYRFPIKVVYTMFGKEYVINTNLAQKAPNGFIMLNDNLTFRVALDNNDNGNYYAREWWSRCGSRVLDRNEASTLPSWSSKIRHRMNFINGNYWTDNTCNVFIAQKNWDFSIAYASNNSLTLTGWGESSILRSKRYRCIRDLNGLTSRSGGTGW